VDELRRQEELIRRSLRGLTDRIGEALEVVAAMGPADPARADVARTAAPVDGTDRDEPNVTVDRTAGDDGDEPNVAVEGIVHDDRDGADVVILAGRPAPVPH
jgi:hypothetical protein